MDLEKAFQEACSQGNIIGQFKFKRRKVEEALEEDQIVVWDVHRAADKRRACAFWVMPSRYELYTQASWKMTFLFLVYVVLQAPSSIARLVYHFAQTAKQNK